MVGDILKCPENGLPKGKIGKRFRPGCRADISTVCLPASLFSSRRPHWSAMTLLQGARLLVQACTAICGQPGSSA